MKRRSDHDDSPHLRWLPTLLLTASLVLTSTFVRAADDESCQPGLIKAAISNPVYGQLFFILSPQAPSLRALLEHVADQPSYANLLTAAKTIAASIPNGRVVITLPDGTVVLDTARPDDPTSTMPSGNSFEHFEDKTVNENHNTRVTILSAQLYSCGVGVESKLSTTTGQSEIYVAIRLGQHLNSTGTARLSTVASAEREVGLALFGELPMTEPGRLWPASATMLRR